MAKSKNNLPNLINQLTKERSKSRSLSSSNLVGTSFSGRADLHLTSSGDARSTFLDFSAAPHSIDFGRPPAEKTSSSKSSNGWTDFLKQAASNGASSALGSSFGFGSFGGIGSIISGIESLFGGHKKAPPPLVRFQLPESQSRTLYVDSNGTGMPDLRGDQGSSGSTPGTGIYSQTSAMSENWLQDQSAQIAQAVKTALLNSSSLSDVIAEL
jgi:hypothetical protein